MNVNACFILDGGTFVLTMKYGCCGQTTSRVKESLAQSLIWKYLMGSKRDSCIALDMYGM